MCVVLVAALAMGVLGKDVVDHSSEPFPSVFRMKLGRDGFWSSFSSFMDTNSRGQVVDEQSFTLNSPMILSSSVLIAWHKLRCAFIASHPRDVLTINHIFNHFLGRLWALDDLFHSHP